MNTENKNDSDNYKPQKRKKDTLLKVGDRVPKVVVKNQRGEDVRLSDFLGKKVILYFYPHDSTPTCTTESCNLRDNFQVLQEKGFVVLGVSADSILKHQNFIKKNNLPFDLLADTNQKLCKAFGVWVEKKTFGITYFGIKRTTFIINEKGKIEVIIEKIDAKRHTEQILK